MTASDPTVPIRISPGRVTTITLNAPARRNAMSREMWRLIARACGEIAADPAVRVVVLRGEGDHFCAGADISEFHAAYADAEATRETNALVRQGQAAVRALPMPVLAEVRGACVGGGCGLALACDLRFAGTSARFAITPARLGLAYSFEDTKQLTDVVGPSRAKDILFSARTIGAEEAQTMGLIDRLVADADLPDAVAAYAGELAALSPTSLRVAKATVEEIVRGQGEASAALRAAFEASFSGADFAEGLRAFTEKRKPDFDRG
jgi:enoyl-CoA hydratase/carnithine racemase